jgi:hypothetical protein
MSDEPTNPEEPGMVSKAVLHGCAGGFLFLVAWITYQIFSWIFRN